MKAMIFAAGIGSRLKPWTDFHPKALVEIGNRPMLGRVIDRMADAGITDIVVNIHHFGDQIIDFVQTVPDNISVSISDERNLLLDTGGGLRKALPLIGNDSVIVHNADIMTDIDLNEFIRTHIDSKADATMLVQDRGSSRQLVFDSDMKLIGWTNRETGETRPHSFNITDSHKLYSFNGVHVLNLNLLQELADYKPDNTPFSIIDFYLHAARKFNIKGVEMPKEKHWFDVGKPETLDAARRWIDKNE